MSVFQQGRLLSAGTCQQHRNIQTSGEPQQGEPGCHISFNPNSRNFGHRVTQSAFPFQCYEVPGLKILTYNGPIYYGNRSFFREEMSRLLGLTPEKIRSREKARKALERRDRDATVNTVVRRLQSLEWARLWLTNQSKCLLIPSLSFLGKRHC